jgi:hypothetical protein
MISTIRASKTKCDFLKSFSADLRKVGLRASTYELGGKLVFKCCTEHLDRFSQSAMQVARSRRLEERWAFINSLQEQGIGIQFTKGADLNPDAVAPQLFPCESKKDKEIFEFCRLTQSVPTARMLYRQLPFIVRDVAHRGLPIVGILGLSSPVYSLGARDQFLGWQANHSDLKEKGLNSCLQLSVCMAVPPYSYLRAGRLIASLALCDEVAREYAMRYSRNGKSPSLLGVVTLSAKGIHAPIFNRIKLRNGGLYRRIGCTSGYSSLAFSVKTLAAARALVIQHDGSCPDNRSISTVKRALNLCRVPREGFLQIGLQKGVYIGVPDDGALEALRSARTNYQPTYPTVAAAISVWRQDVKKALRIAENVEKFLGFDPVLCRATKKKGFFDETV